RRWTGYGSPRRYRAVGTIATASVWRGRGPSRRPEGTRRIPLPMLGEGESGSGARPGPATPVAGDTPEGASPSPSIGRGIGRVPSGRREGHPGPGAGQPPPAPANLTATPPGRGTRAGRAGRAASHRNLAGDRGQLLRKAPRGLRRRGPEGR